MLSKNTKSILVRARFLVDKGWTQYTAARDSAHRPTCTWDKNACQFCITGAVERAVYDLRLRMGQGSALSVLSKASSGVLVYGLTGYNDTLGRTKKQVVELFDRAIECTK